MKRKRLMPLLFIPVLLLSGCTPPEALNGVIGKAENVLEQSGLYEAPAAPDYGNVSDYSELDAECFDAPPAPGYYIVHGEKYYPMCYPDWCDDETFAQEQYGDSESDQMKVTGVRIALENQYDPYIPTLYLSAGDSLVYCSGDYLLEFYYFTKFDDLGYSVPITSFEETVGGYPYLYLSHEAETGDEGGVLIDAETKKLFLNQSVLTDDDADATLRIYSVNDTPFTSDYIKDGIISGLTRDTTYQFNGAFGTLDFQWTLPASYHFFKQSELYGEAAYEAAYDGQLTLPIPDYLTDGYYMLSDGGMFRLLREASGYNLYNAEAFNAKSLGLDTQYALENGGTMRDDGSVAYADGQTAVDDTHMYSSNKDLCAYTTKVPGALGYVKPEAEEELQDAESSTEKTSAEIAQPQVAYYKLVPEDTSDDAKASIPAESVVCTLASLATNDRTPCMISYALKKGAAVTLPFSKDEENGQYAYTCVAERKLTISNENPLYLALYYQSDSNLALTGIMEGLQAVSLADTSEVPQTLLEAVSASSTQ